MTRINTNSDRAHICPLNCVAKTSSPPAPHHIHVGSQPTRLSCVCVSVSPLRHVHNDILYIPVRASAFILCASDAARTRF